MASRQKINYFDTLCNQSEYSLRASKLLEDFLSQYTISDVFEIQNKTKALKNSCKSECNNLLTALREEFLPPMDRGDILSLSRNLQKVCEVFCDAFECIYIYNPCNLTRQTVILSSLSDSICKEMHKAVCEMKNFKKSDKLSEIINTCNDLHDEAYEVYGKAIRALMNESNDMRKLLSFTKIYDSIIKCCDACKNAVLLIEAAVMKNA